SPRPQAAQARRRRAPPTPRPREPRPRRRPARRPDRPRRRTHPTLVRGRPCGRIGQTPPLRRFFARRGRLGPGRRAPHRRAGLGLRPSLAIPATLPIRDFLKNLCRIPGPNGALVVGEAIADPRTLSRPGGLATMDLHKPDLKTLFCEALERPAGPERSAYLQGASRANP